MNSRDIAGVTCWVAVVGICVEQGWTVALISMAIGGGLMFLLNSGPR